MYPKILLYWHYISLTTSNVAQTPLTLYWKENSTIQIKWSIASCRISSIHLCLFQIYLYFPNAHSLHRIISSNESIAVKIKTRCAHPMDSLTRHCCLKRTFGEAFKSATSRSSAPLWGATHGQPLSWQSLSPQLILLFHLQFSGFIFSFLRKILGFKIEEFWIGNAKDYSS